MVKFRGIDVSIVSQFDIRKLPEFKPRESDDAFYHNEPTLQSDDNSIASCYVPLYPGSQIWFEYSIDGPHPPQAAYFFKLLHNGQEVTSWDCTAKHAYHGKTTYNIQYVGNDSFTGMPLVKRQAFKFSPQSRQDVGAFDDCIEVRVHRIEHRQKVPLEDSKAACDQLPGKMDKETGLRLTNGGLLEPGCPKRRYRYQLLDPTDEPYATIRFYYRSYEFLQDQRIINSPSRQCRTPSSASSGDSWSFQSASPHRCLTVQSHEESVDSSHATINAKIWRYAHDSPRMYGLEYRAGQLRGVGGGEVAASTEPDPEANGITKPKVRVLLAGNTAMRTPRESTDAASQTPVNASQSSERCSPECDRSDSVHFDSLRRCTDDLSRSMTEDSLEIICPTHVDHTMELHVRAEAVAVSAGDECNTRHLEEPYQDTVTSSFGSKNDELPQMPAVADTPKVKASPKKLQKKALMLNLEGADFDLEKERKPRRPLSPFTSGGALRRMISPVPPSAPPAVTEFGPRISEEIEEKANSERSESKAQVVAEDKPVRTSRAERGGHLLLSFLAKRIGRTE